MAAWLVGEARVAQGSYWIILEYFRAYLVRPSPYVPFNRSSGRGIKRHPCPL